MLKLIKKTLKRADRFLTSQYQKMTTKDKIGLVALIFMGFLVMLLLLLQNDIVAVLSPAGEIARRQRQLIILGVLLSLIVVLPVFVMTFVIAWRYRETNTKAKYQPDWDHSRTFETIWWTVPLILILILSAVTWRSSHTLDPFKSLVSSNKPMTIQVVALEWKWLFIYPEENIATVNFLEFPVNTPINFQITADAPMNSFWIPRLGGQIYAMSGMSTRLNLIANQIGEFQGHSANISGTGFASMNFTAKATGRNDYEAWLAGVKQSSNYLSDEAYSTLAKPGVELPTQFYYSTADNLYPRIVNKFSQPSGFLSEPDRVSTFNQETN